MEATTAYLALASTTLSLGIIALLVLLSRKLNHYIEGKFSKMPSNIVETLELD